MKKKKGIILAIVCVTLVGLALVGPIMSDVEHPKYTVVSTTAKNIEVRQYEPMIIAEVAVEGPRQEAIRDGFRLVADYIFGNNTVEQEIAMTAPVQQESSAQIAMTAPVQQQAEDGVWKVSFIMPSAYDMSNLPQPNNPQVKLKKIPARYYAVIRFSGLTSNENVQKHEAQLLAHVQKSDMRVMGAPKYAFYNPPWTLPFMRRNEVMIEITKP